MHLILDRILARTLNVAAIGLICAAGALSILIGYSGVLNLLAASVGRAAAQLIAAMLLGVVACRLARHRHELADS